MSDFLATLLIMIGIGLLFLIPAAYFGGKMGVTLLFGGWTNPAGWAGALFVGAGASIGAEIDSNWWPY